MEVAVVVVMNMVEAIVIVEGKAGRRPVPTGISQAVAVAVSVTRIVVRVGRIAVGAVVDRRIGVGGLRDVRGLRRFGRRGGSGGRRVAARVGGVAVGVGEFGTIA